MDLDIHLQLPYIPSLMTSLRLFLALCLAAFTASAQDMGSTGGIHSARRAIGPLKLAIYSSLIQRPEVHGYYTIELTRADGSGIDSFKVRQNVTLDNGAPEIVLRDVKRVVDGRDVEVVDFELVFEGEGSEEATPSSRTFTVTWREILD